MSVPDEVRRDAERTGELIRKKLLRIMDLQADIDGLLREGQPTPFGSQKWQSASLEALQRLVAMTAIQFVLFEPVDWVKCNDEFKVAADRMIEIIVAQLKTLRTRRSDW
jgi:malonyl CoA-acyl carrier protein transacylase